MSRTQIGCVLSKEIIKNFTNLGSLKCNLAYHHLHYTWVYKAKFHADGISQELDLQANKPRLVRAPSLPVSNQNWRWLQIKISKFQTYVCWLPQS